MNQAEEIEVIARAVLTTNDGRIALCRVKDAKWFFLPGGHIELGETAIPALRRELREELGLHEVTVGDFVGAVENLYSLNGKAKHELNLIFNVSTPVSTLRAIEDHICIEAFPPEKIPDLELKPQAIKSMLNCAVPTFSTSKS